MSKFEYKLGNKLNLDDFEIIEKKLNLIFPEKIKSFYMVVNELKTLNPDFEIIKLNELKNEDSLIHFATFDKTKQICFMTEKLNNANEWTIIEKESKYEVTLTISSLWSNKIWYWLEKKKNIWEKRKSQM